MLNDIKAFFNPLTNSKAIGIIIVVGSIVYFNSLLNGFIGDDLSQIVNNTQIHSVLNIPKFFTGSTFYSGQADYLSGIYYKPVMQVFFSIIYSTTNPHALPFHLFQITVHIMNAFLLFLLFKHFYRKRISLILSLIFLVHPINSEAVLYISATQDVLFFFFGMLGLLCLIDKLDNKKYVILGSFFLLLSLLSKETGILFMIIVAVYGIIYNRKKIFIYLTVVLLPTILYFILRINAVGLITNPNTSPIDKLNLTERLLNIPSIIFLYLKTFAYPINIVNGYRWAYTDLNHGNFTLPLMIILFVIIIITYIGILLYKKHLGEQIKTYIFFTSWFIVGLLLHLQIIPLDMTAAERWFYFPIVGALGILPILFERLPLKMERKTIYIIILIVLLALSLRTVVRSFNWRDQLALKSHDIKITKEYDYTAYNYIGATLINKGELSEAKKYVDKSISLSPSNINYNLLGVIYVKQGDYAKAKEAYVKGLTYSDDYNLYDSMGKLGTIYGDPIENIKFLKDALRKFPQNSNLWLYLAILEYKSNNLEEARNAINQAYNLDQNTQTIYVKNIIFYNEELIINLK